MKDNVDKSRVKNEVCLLRVFVKSICSFSHTLVLWISRVSTVVLPVEKENRHIIYHAKFAIYVVAINVGLVATFVFLGNCSRFPIESFFHIVRCFNASEAALGCRDEGMAAVITALTLQQ